METFALTSKKKKPWAIYFGSQIITVKFSTPFYIKTINCHSSIDENLYLNSNHSNLSVYKARSWWRKIVSRADNWFYCLIQAGNNRYLDTRIRLRSWLNAEKYQPRPMRVCVFTCWFGLLTSFWHPDSRLWSPTSKSFKRCWRSVSWETVGKKTGHCWLNARHGIEARWFQMIVLKTFHNFSRLEFEIQASHSRDEKLDYRIFGQLETFFLNLSKQTRRDIRFTAIHAISWRLSGGVRSGFQNQLKLLNLNLLYGVTHEVKIRHCLFELTQF